MPCSNAASAPTRGVPTLFTTVERNPIYRPGGEIARFFARRPDPQPVQRRGPPDLYGERLERIVLFGSRARGDHRPDSDYDFAVFIKGEWELWDELGALAEITTDILIDTDVVISAKAFPAGSHARRSPLMAEIRRDGLLL